MASGTSKLVYSTEQTVPKREQPAPKPAGGAVFPSTRKVYVKLDRKGRGGKIVTVIEGLPMRAKDKEVLLKQLKARFGAGGAMKDAVIEIQGDHAEAIMQHLVAMGLLPKRAGG